MYFPVSKAEIGRRWLSAACTYTGTAKSSLAAATSIGFMEGPLSYAACNTEEAVYRPPPPVRVLRADVSVCLYLYLSSSRFWTSFLTVSVSFLLNSRLMTSTAFSTSIFTYYFS